MAKPGATTQASSRESQVGIGSGRVMRWRSSAVRRCNAGNPAAPPAFRRQTEGGAGMAEERKGTGEPGWTEAEKSPNPAGRAEDTGRKTGEAEPKGRPTNDREAMETAAARI